METLNVREDFFETDTMTWIDNQQDGHVYSNITIKLLLKTIKYNGKLVKIENGEMLNLTNEDISNLANVNKGLIDKCIKLLESIGLIKENKVDVRYIDYTAFK